MDFKEIKELIKVFDKSELNKLKIKESDFEISMGKGFDGTVEVASAPVAQQIAAPSPSISAPVETSCTTEKSTQTCSDTINSPMVGTFYAAPSPDSSAFVKPGDTVKKGDTLCILEAMKIMNEVEAECDCKILEVLVNDADPVEFDMPLFTIEKL
ncbi:acetyl-CoA carboxylase, biotin carboxyl carrier protein [Malaciobacter halophilus]|uniref:Biotin carboxyl carrier protein of acetyl-CoA carboxylase n=1 Tax=Malaciobacter halophilus TaxID=197482 RepID=A0A2N1J1A3_9BACT|nr:acetyl-CoA carboxylase biotin carboxyl carrier protein [Malaciobacter halophilus]AXH08489.1 acetyl-CoA carboxylase, biotin carboxyl carrier protein [Malaciobacter halophilus]PKI80272.1 acetyl-CoA carboxylase, biotin carboxyl carrier protein [Malaciobacter halophilus]